MPLKNDFFRNVVPSLDSQYLINKNFVGRKSYMIAEDNNLLLMICGEIQGIYKSADKMMLDGLIDSINQGIDIAKRHQNLSKLLIDRAGKEIENFLDEGPYTIPTENIAFHLLPRDLRLLVEEVYSYNKFVDNDVRLEDNKKIHGVNTLNSSFFENLTIINGKRLFLIRPTAIEAKELKDDLAERGIVANIVGSIGRGEPTGHDIDLLVDSSYKEALENFFEPCEKIASNRYAISINNIFFQVDINYLFPEDNAYVTYFHFMGPKNKNIKAAIKAKKMGYKLGTKNLTETSTGNKIDVNSDKELLDLIDFEYINSYVE